MDDGDVTDAAVIKPMQNHEGEKKESLEDRGQGLLVKVVLFIGITDLPYVPLFVFIIIMNSRIMLLSLKLSVRSFSGLILNLENLENGIFAKS